MSSFSWIANKTPSELNNILKSTYTALRERDRDLRLAAEVGKTLLENNEALAQKCDELQEQIDDRDMIVLPEHDEDDDQSAHLIDYKQDDQKSLIHSLENKNAELQHKYESTVEYNEKVKRQNLAAQRRLAKQIEDLQKALEEAYEKVQEQEAYRQECLNAMKLKKKQNEDKPSPSGAVEVSLSNQIDQMTMENHQLFKTKDQMESQYNEAIADLRYLHDQFGKIQQSKGVVHNLEERYEEQKNHIHELTSWLDEYRHDLSSHCDKRMVLRKTRSNKNPERIPTQNEHYSRQLMIQHRNRLQSNELPGISIQPAMNESISHSPRSAIPALINEDTREYSSSDESGDETELPVLYQNIPINDDDENSLFNQLKSSLPSEEEAVQYPLDRVMKIVPHNSPTNTALIRNPSYIRSYPALRIDDSIIPPSIKRPIDYHPQRRIKSNSNTTIIGHIINIPFNYFNYVWRCMRFIIVVHIAMLINVFFKKN
ncbi:hypothetical protein BDB01DRAFT_834756 [Pilobolus umbonatus]|nr:hypothetical protein BDB01DRAFT_834756 [Pilobolus umbonatus]